MATTSPGLAPLSPPGVEVRADVLAAIPDDVKALVIGPCLDMIQQGAAKGASDHVLMCLRGMLRRVVRGCHDVEVRRGAARELDIDTTGFGDD